LNRQGASLGRAAPVKEDPSQQQGALNVNKSCLVAALAAVVVWMGPGGNQGAAQAPVPYRSAAGAPPVAVVDIAYIFKNAPRFEDQEKALMHDADNVRLDFQKEAKSLNAQAGELQQLTPGTPDYKNREEYLFKKQSDLKTRMQLVEKEFRQRDAKIRYNMYQEILQEVRHYCEANGIALVINYNHEPINPEITESVMPRIMQNVVYSNQNLDITPFLLQRIGPKTANNNFGPMGVTAPLNR
jgi:Skp family chaperone for outer membrane proteins